jgi:glycosyltransferase involved in cell wall biosynthesis
VGNNAFYKNRHGVVRIFTRVLKEYNILLKMAGPAPPPELSDLVAKLGLKKHVEFVVDPDGDELAALYREARLFLFPSLYEGFGWPPLEAMSSGCPVVCSDAASLPEVVGDAALTCPASDEEKMALNCLSILREGALAEDLIQRGYVQAGKFTLKKMGEELFRVYSQVSDGTAKKPGGCEA